MTTVTTPAVPAVEELRAATSLTAAVMADPQATPAQREAAAQAEASLYDRAAPQALARLDAELEAGA